MNITSFHPGQVSIERVFTYWVKAPTSQKLDKLFLNGVAIWDISDPDSPSDIPSEGNWNGANRLIPSINSANFIVQLQEPLAAGNYSVSIVFDISCQVLGSFTVP